jgi:hypothetical protein
MQARVLSPEQMRIERAKAERASYIVSEALSDRVLETEALNGLEATERGLCLLWQEFLRWENTRRGVEADSQHAKLHVNVELRLAPKVRDLLIRLSPDDRQLLELDVQEICANPTIDNVTKFALPSPPIVLILYQKGPYRVVYQNHNVVGVDLLYVDRAEQVPSIEEWANAS